MQDTGRMMQDTRYMISIFGFGLNMTFRSGNNYHTVSFRLMPVFSG